MTLTRTLTGLAGAILLAGGSALTVPQDPWVSSDVALGLALIGGALAAIAVLWGREWLALSGLITALSGTLPPELPVSWAPSVLVLVGAMVTLEAARARRERGPMPPLRAFLLPGMILLAGLLVPLASLATQAGRESLDLSQGIGVAVSAPFLLLAAWGILHLIYQRRGRTPGASAIAGVALIALLITVAPGADAEEIEFDGMQMTEIVMVDDSGAQGRQAQNSWTVSESQVVLFRPFTAFIEESNTTIIEAEVEIQNPIFINPFGDDAQCQHDVTLRLSRATQPWGTSTVWSTLPNATDGVTVTWTAQDCAARQPIVFPVDEHYEAWVEGAAPQGWLLELVSTTVPVTGGDSGGEVELSGSAFGTSANLVYDPNPPRVRAITSRPSPINNTLLAPVGHSVTFNVTVEDPAGGLHHVAVLQNGTELARTNLTGPVNGTEIIQVTVPILGETPEGTLVVEARDWDGNRHNRTWVNLALDPQDPTITLDNVPPEEVDEGESFEVTFRPDDDSCPRPGVNPCLKWTATTDNGTLVGQGRGNSSAVLTLPSATPGRNAVTIKVTDAAARVSERAIVYNVRESRAPVLTDIQVLGARGEAIQEAGLPIRVLLNATDETPPLAIEVREGGELLANATSLSNRFNISVLIAEPGEHDLTIHATDFWGNNATATTKVTIESSREPIITFPAGTYIGEGAELVVELEDLTLRPRNVSATATSNGALLSDLATQTRRTPGGLELTLQVPSLLHDEQATFVVTAIDDAGNAASGQATYTADLRAPTITLRPTQGVQEASVLWSHPTAPIALEAGDEGSGLASLTLLEPRRAQLALNATQLDPTTLRDGNLSLRAQDLTGNTAYRNLTLRLDGQAPELALEIQGHDLLVTVAENASGLADVNLTVDQAPQGVPIAPGTHRVALDGVVRGDEIRAVLTASDRVGHEAELTERLTVQDAAPVIQVGQRDDRVVPVTVRDADQDPIEITVTATHRVRERTVALEIVDDSVELPDWAGEILLRVEASAHGRTVTHESVILRGEGPFLTARAQADGQTGEPISVNVSWDRVPSKLTVVATRDGAEVASQEVDATGRGYGEATFEFEDGGTYELTARMITEDGNVEIAQAGTVEVDEPLGWIPILLIALVIIGVAGWALQYGLSRQQEDEER